MYKPVKLKEWKTKPKHS